MVGCVRQKESNTLQIVGALRIKSFSKVNQYFPYSSLFFQGFLFPSLHALVAHWAPPAEKGKFVSCLLGGAIGTVVTWSLTGPLIENFGWSAAFYVPGKMYMK